MKTSTNEPLVAWWAFDAVEEGKALDQCSGLKDRIEGRYKRVHGVVGAALKLDGFTTAVVREARQAPVLSGAFTIEAWIALGAYPWNFCAIAAQRRGETAGYDFAVGPRGEVRLSIATADTCIRKVMWKRGSLGPQRQFQESLPLSHPGQVQGDIVEREYVTIANLDNQTATLCYTERPGPSDPKDLPENPLIQRYNFKSHWRPFILTRREPGSAPLHLRLAANDKTPAFNPVIVVEGWGENDAHVAVDGKPAQRGQDYRTGISYRLDRTDLVVWFRLQATAPVELTISQGKSGAGN